MARTKEVRVQTSFRLPEDLFNRLNDQAHLRDLSVNWLVTRAIDLFLQRLEAPAPTFHIEIPDA
jgi:predicted transcriptional regulator